MNPKQSVEVLEQSSKFFNKVDEDSASSDEFGEVKTKMVKSFYDELMKGNYCAALVMHIGLYIFGFGLGTKSFFIEGFHSSANVNAHDLKKSLENKLAYFCIEQWKRPESGKGRQHHIWNQEIDAEDRINALWSGKVTSLVETYKHVGGRDFFDKKWPGGECLDDFEKGQRLLRILSPNQKDKIINLSETCVLNKVSTMNDMVKQYMYPGTEAELPDLWNVAETELGSWIWKWSMKLDDDKVLSGIAKNSKDIAFMLGETLEDPNCPQNLALEIHKEPNSNGDAESAQRDGEQPLYNDLLNQDRGDKDTTSPNENQVTVASKGGFSDSDSLDNIPASESDDSDATESTTSTAKPKILRRLRKGLKVEAEDIASIFNDSKDPSIASKLTGAKPPRVFTMVLKGRQTQERRSLLIAQSRIWVNSLFIGVSSSIIEHHLMKKTSVLQARKQTDALMSGDLGWDVKKAFDHRNAARMTMGLYIQICNKTDSEEMSSFILLILSETITWKTLRKIAQTKDTAREFINDIVSKVIAGEVQYKDHACKGISILNILIHNLRGPIEWTDIYGQDVDAKMVLGHAGSSLGDEYSIDPQTVPEDQPEVGTEILSEPGPTLGKRSRESEEGGMYETAKKRMPSEVVKKKASRGVSKNVTGSERRSTRIMALKGKVAMDTSPG